MRRDKRRPKTHRCQVCGAYGATQIHHIFGGASRKISEKHDLVIELCPACHRKAHEDADFSCCLKHDCQLEWLENGGSMDDWMAMMHRSWVIPEEVKWHKRAPAVDLVPPWSFDDEEGKDGTCEGSRRGHETVRIQMPDMRTEGPA